MSAADADLVRQAIGILTSVARQTRVRGAGTPAATTEPVDFADIIAHVLTSVAANVGCVETLLAGRSGSWEADLVRRLVDGTAGYDGDLVLWRSDRVRLPFDAENVFFSFYISDLFEREYEKAIEHADDEALTEAQREAAEALTDAIERLWEHDRAAYTAAYLATAQRYLTERGATCGVELVADLAVGASASGDGLAEQVDAYAIEHTPLPMTGNAPDWSEGTPADALRRAGLTYIARVPDAELDDEMRARLAELADSGCTS